MTPAGRLAPVTGRNRGSPWIAQRGRAGPSGRVGRDLESLPRGTDPAAGRPGPVGGHGHRGAVRSAVPGPAPPGQPGSAQATRAAARGIARTARPTGREHRLRPPVEPEACCRRSARRVLARPGQPVRVTGGRPARQPAPCAQESNLIVLAARHLPDRWPPGGAAPRSAPPRCPAQLTAYRRRDRVALLTFRGTRGGHRVVVPPTGSVRARRPALRDLSRSAERTPLAAGLEASPPADRAQALGGIRPAAPILVLITDGRATGGSSDPMTRGRAGR